MKILVIGLDCAAPEIVLGDPRLTNLRRLMDAGCYGRLETIVPPITVPAWMCFSTSRDPGSLGAYGFRNRADHSYEPLRIVDSRTIRGQAAWDQVACEGKRATIVGVPPNYPPRKVNGVSVGCFLTPDAATSTFTYPESIGPEILAQVGDYPVDVRGFRTDDKPWLQREIYAMSRKHFQIVRHLMRTTDWDYFQFVEIGLDRIQHGFWKHHDPEHRQHVPGSEFAHVVRDYYRYLDDEIGQILELLDEETTVLVLSDHGAQRLDGGFCINEWLIREGYLALHTYPDRVTPLSQLDIDWERTTAWGEGGYYARVFLNVKGREPCGTVDPADAGRVRDELAEQLEATEDDRGRKMGTVAFRPEEIYREIRRIPPDLIVHFGGLYWRSVGGVGYGTLHVQENDTGPDDCNHAQFGAFILAAPGFPLSGPREGTHLLDLAPTILEWAGYDVPETMQGVSLVSGQATGAAAGSGLNASEEETLRQRLSGLGYI